MHENGLERRRGVGHGRQVIEGGTLPSLRIINFNILGVGHPPDEYWDRYYRYVAPQTQPRPKGKAAAPHPSGGAAAAGPKTPKQPDHPPPVARTPKEPSQPPRSWTPTLRSADHPVQPAKSGPLVTATSISVPKAG